MKRLIVPRSQRTSNGTSVPSEAVIIVASSGIDPSEGGSCHPPLADR